MSGAIAARVVDDLQEVRQHERLAVPKRVHGRPSGRSKSRRPRGGLQDAARALFGQPGSHLTTVPKSARKEWKLRTSTRHQLIPRTRGIAGLSTLLEGSRSTTENRGVPGSSGSRCQRAWRCAARRPPLPRALRRTMRAARHPLAQAGGSIANEPIAGREHSPSRPLAACSSPIPPWGQSWDQTRPCWTGLGLTRSPCVASD